MIEACVALSLRVDCVLLRDSLGAVGWWRPTLQDSMIISPASLHSQCTGSWTTWFCFLIVAKRTEELQGKHRAKGDEEEKKNYYVVLSEGRSYVLLIERSAESESLGRVYNPALDWEQNICLVLCRTWNLILRRGHWRTWTESLTLCRKINLNDYLYSNFVQCIERI